MLHFTLLLACYQHQWIAVKSAQQLQYSLIHTPYIHTHALTPIDSRRHTKFRVTREAAYFHTLHLVLLHIWILYSFALYITLLLLSSSPSFSLILLSSSP